MTAISSCSKRKHKKKGFMYHIIKDHDLYIMLTPAIIFTIVFYYLPMYGVSMAFQDFNMYDGFFGSPFVGLKHFINFFNYPYAFRIIRNTFMLGTFYLLWSFTPPIIFALLLNELRNKTFKRITQSISYLPHFVSVVIVVGMIFRVLESDGVVNSTLQYLGLEKAQFFLFPKYFRSIYIMSGIWQTMGWGSILYLAALTGIPGELYEAAGIEGASRLQRVKYITIPGIMPTIIILLILNMKNIINIGFEKVLLLYNPAIYETSDVLSTYIYRIGIQGSKYSYASAIGFLNSVVAFLFVIVTNKIAKTFSETSLW